MKIPSLFLALGFLIVSALSASAQTANAAQPDPWPRTQTVSGTTYTVYQPQLESWDGVNLAGTAAVSVQAKGADQAVFGTLTMTATTYVDKSSRMVQLQNLQITQAQFPSQPDQAPAYLKTFQSFIPVQVKSISLDRLEANLAIINQKLKGSAQPIQNNPPSIIFSQNPSLLVLIDGDPVYRDVPGTKLQRVFNTRVLLLKDASGKHYLHVLDGYMEAPSLAGPWTVSANLPDDVQTAEKAAVAAKAVDLLAGQPDPDTGKLASLKTQTPPVIYISSSPAELIITAGPADWTPIPSTQLLFVQNTVSHVFKNMADQSTYVLISGRWFKAPSFSGPWTFVPGNTLPKDFAAIPDSSPKENAKASVPGTQQAKESAIANSIPNTQAVNRKTAKMDPVPAFDGGTPLLKELDGTPYQYAVNTQIPVVRLDEKNWIACQNGVWFSGASPKGPWAPSIAVPVELYGITVSSSLHYLTYVRIYGYDANTVWVGFTPGYNGTIVTADGIVVYGTGYDYVAYVGTTIYVAPPVTYGYNTNPCWSPWAGWAFGFAAGWAWGSSYNYWCYGPAAPYWGPYWGNCYTGARYNAYGGVTAWGPYGWAGTSGNIYRQNGAWSSVSRTAGGYNAVTGNRWGTQYGHAYNSVTGTNVVGQRGAVENVYTGNYATGARGVAYNSNTGMVADGAKVTTGNAYTGNSTTVGKANVYNPNTGNTTHIAGAKGNDGGALSVNGNVVAGHDGNVYTKGSDGTWNQVNKPAADASLTQNRPDAQNNAAQARTDFQNNPGQAKSNFQNNSSNFQKNDFSNFQNQSRSQDVGQQRFNSFQQSHPSFGGGGFGRGGGGGGRRR